MLTPRAVFERLGGFDERFFMYYEDVDLCRRVRDAGLEVVYFADAEIRHVGGRSAASAPTLTRHERLRSLMKYLAKRHGPARSRFFKAAFLPLLALRLAVDIPMDAGSALKYLLRGDRAKASDRVRRAGARLSLLCWGWVRVALA